MLDEPFEATPSLPIDMSALADRCGECSNANPPSSREVFFAAFGRGNSKLSRIAKRKQSYSSAWPTGRIASCEEKPLTSPRLRIIYSRLFGDTGIPAELKTIHSIDGGAEFYLDNVDVGGISPSEDYAPEFLLAIVNGKVGNFVFRRISKPFRGDYLSANRQFIEPLPVPHLSPEDRTEIGEAALALQGLYTRRADVMARLAHRLASTPSRSRRLDWLFPSVPGVNQRSENAPGSVDDPQRWARMQYEQDMEAEYVRVQEALHPDVDLEAEFSSGELRLLADRAPIIDGIFLDDEEGQFIAAQWNAAVANYTPSARNPGKALATALRKLTVSENAALRRQIIELSIRASDLNTQIADGEDAIEELLAAAYALTDEERRLVSMG